jgi:hypothetical protein
VRLCGISSRFQLLSPGTGQVPHALLTRPPLSIRHLPPEGFRRLSSVRLACVRHAASVHPEPGSNSQIKVCPSPKLLLGLSLIYRHTDLSVIQVRVLFNVSIVQPLLLLKIIFLNFQGCLTVQLSSCFLTPALTYSRLLLLLSGFCLVPVLALS